jgi:hypothetical protein
MKGADMTVSGISTRVTRAFVALALVLGSTVMAALPARAQLVEVTTALDVADTHNPGDLKAALRQAVERVLHETIAFKPTMVALTDARVVGEKLLVRLLIADAEGEEMLQALQRNGNGNSNGDSESASPDEEETRI